MHEFCPRCDANLTLQKGYSNDLPYWICRGCGEMLINPEADSEIVWICDNCGAYLNLQEGFSEEAGSWKCTECGFENVISSREVYLSEEEFRTELKNPLRGMSDKDILALMKYEELYNLAGRDNVFLVKNSDNGRIYVKKVYADCNPEVIRYLSEHPIAQMPRIVEVFEAEKYVTIIEEYIEGKTLESILGERLLSLDEAIRITRNVCISLKELHSVNPPIIHRDVKPGNIIISKEGQTYLLDINIAKWYDEEETEDTKMAGTRYYAAPEQLGFGKGASSPKTDIYGVGVTLNRMLTGKIPKEMIPQGKVGQIIEKCVSLDEENRYSAVELIAEVDELMSRN